MFIFFQESGSRTRLSFIHNPALDDENSVARRHISPIISHLITHNLLSKVSLKEFDVLLSPDTSALDGMGSSSGQRQFVLSENSVVYQLLRDIGVPMDGIPDSQIHERYTVASRLFARELGLTPGELSLVVNGRVCSHRSS